MTVLERIAIVAVSFAIAVAVIVILSGGPLTGSDDPGITGPTSQIGTAVPATSATGCCRPEAPAAAL